MKYNLIPNTDLRVSAVCMGTMTFGSPVEEKDAVRLVKRAMELGVNFFDTANMYEGYNRVPGSAGGVGEELLGKGIAGARDRVVVATKVGMKVGPAPEDEFTSPAAIEKHLKLSLARLGTDYVDIYYLHKPDPHTPPEEILAAMEKQMKAGYVRAYGVSNYSAEDLSRLLRAADRNSLPRPAFCEPALSLLKREALEKLLPLCAKEKIAVVPYQILQGGLLTGKYRRGNPPPEGSRKAEKASWMWEFSDEVMDQVEAVRTEAEKEKISMTQYVVRWTLAQPAVVSALVGVKRESQLEEAVGAV